MRILIVGCGYLGLATGALLVRAGHDVFGLRRSAAADDELRTAGITPLHGDLTRPGDLAALPGPFDGVVNAVSSSRGGVDVYRAVYLGGVRNLLAWLAPCPPRRLVHVSSTSVYAQADGSVVDEDSEAVGASETSRVLVETEKVLLEAARGGFPAVILRVAGIYGPGRGHLFQQFLAGEARSAPAGSRILNMIHRDDAAAAVGAALEGAAAGGVYNVVDDEPVPQRTFLAWLAERTGRPMPPDADPGAGGPRKRGVTDKRVSNRRMRETFGWVPAHPTFREGYAGLMAGVFGGGNGGGG